MDRWLRALCVTLVGAVAVGAGSASAALVPSNSLGVNTAGITVVAGQYVPSNLSTASAAGLGVARDQVTQGRNADIVVAGLAAVHLRLYPVMALAGPQLAPEDAASAMAQFVTSFAQRYGPSGTFWLEHPELPYLPVMNYEIGNEPNIPLQWVADTTYLHWLDPSAYAQVYEAARAALHQVVPDGKAVVGGLADSGTLGVDIQHDEQWLAALTPGTVDAVGYHPYLFQSDISLMKPDTLALRQWMDAHELQGVPLDINEHDACDVIGHGTQPVLSAKLALEQRLVGCVVCRLHAVGAVHARPRGRERPGLLVGRSPWN